MTQYAVASPQLSVKLFKTIDRKGQPAVSTRYQGKDEAIDLTPFLDAGSSVRTSKNVREPAGGFVLTFADRPQSQSGSSELESIYGLVEPMDIVEIRMWGGVGPTPAKLPIVMRGFVSNVRRAQAMTGAGPQRQVVVSGQDYGKIWQTFQVIHLIAYAESKNLLTNFALWQLFGVAAQNVMPAGGWVRAMIDKIINPHMAGFMPSNSTVPRSLKTGDSISVAHGKVNDSYQSMQGSIYDILKLHGDVGIWNELYTEDREDGVHVVYRPIPALDLYTGKKIQDDAPDPVFCPIADDVVKSLVVDRSDANVSNFYWVNGARLDVITDMQRRLAAIPADDARVSIHDYANSARKYYGDRAMYGDTQQADDATQNFNSGEAEAAHRVRDGQLEAWVDKRRRIMMEMNRDNVVFERGTASVKGGVMRVGNTDLMRAGDYARIKQGRFEFDAYVPQIEHEYAPLSHYTQTLTLERGNGFAKRMASGNSPWLTEQAT